MFGNEGRRHPETGARMSQRLMQNMLSGMPQLGRGSDTLAAARGRAAANPASPYMNNLTLKQFRDAQEPDLACYQALVNSKISIERFIDGGLLGGSSVMMGDATGGYRIHVHEYAEQAIVETLGLEVSDTSRDEFGAPVAVLSPLLPSWMACDLRYDMGTTLAWRSKRSQWCDRTDCVPPERPDKRGNRFNTARGAAMQDSVGPFHYPDTTMRILPLKADRRRLQEFCDEFITGLKQHEDGAKAFETLIEDFEEKAAAIRDARRGNSGPGGTDHPEISSLRKELDDQVRALRDSMPRPKMRALSW